MNLSINSFDFSMKQYFKDVHSSRPPISEGGAPFPLPLSCVVHGTELANSQFTRLTENKHFEYLN